ncbi:penicillin acylase family protein [Massilia sp. erpn]|uniref:penicillin acylase family protein n=1 Tax=Massilia sp. erpn TaxID=2738142 RepID=UPI002107D20F|nr:penicillin acylase family protein [Massilia sp. erpn]UTY59039.1 penicillin acylase family protein [Massilia sp. erpn]
MAVRSAGGVGRWVKRGVLLLLALLVLALLAAWFFLRGSLAQLDGRRTVPGLTATVTIARDAQGVPTISGSDRLDVAYATGFVHGQDRFFQMDLLRRVAAGELSELFGPKALVVDRPNRLHRFRARAEQAVAAMAPADRALLERYAAGANEGLNALGTRPFEYGLISLSPRAWTPADSLLVIWAMYFDLQGRLEARELARGWLRENSSAEQLAFLLPEATAWDTPLDGVAPPPPAPLPERAPDWWGKQAAKNGDEVAAIDFVDAVGSNNWALAGSRNGGGGAIVADDMHLGIKLPNTWYRAVLAIPDAAGGTRRLVGVTLPGAPLIVVGSNGRVAWGFTNSYGDYLDLIAAEEDAAKPGQVKLAGGGWEKLTVHQETILVKGAAAEQLTVRESSAGPLRQAGGRTYAVHWTAHAPGAVNVSMRKLEAANNLDEALAIAATLGIPAQNFVGGDDKGNIGWTIAGMLPRRAAPSLASTFPLAADTVGAGWSGWLAPQDYPVVRNPASGQLHTANSRQLLGPGAELLGDGGLDLGARSQQVGASLTALGAQADERAVYGVMLDDRALFMAGWRARALAALATPGASTDPKRAELARLLKTGWNGHASVDSTAYRITRAFMWSLYELLYGAANADLHKLDEEARISTATARWPAVLARLLDEQPAGWLPAQYASWTALQLAALDRTAAELAPDGKPLSAATWGARNTAGIAHPIAGAVPALRQWLSVPPDQLPGDSNMPRVAGRTFGQSERLTVSPGREEQGIFNMPGGQSGHPLSPFFLAGHEDWVKGKPTPLLPGPAQYLLTLTK